MKKYLLLVVVLTCLILTTAACASRLKETSGTPGTASDIESTVVLSSETTLSTVPESNPTKAPKPTPTEAPTVTPTPTEAALPFTFDLTEDEITETGDPLMFIGGADEAVIIGGQTSPLTKKGSFYSGIERVDWNETAYYNDSGFCNYSIDRSKAVFSVEGEEGNPSLIYYGGTKANIITTNFSDFACSLTGNSVAYTMTNNGIDELYIYDCEKKESRLICKDFECDYGDFCISPSGDAILYADYNDSLYMIIGDNAPEKISSFGSPLAITDGGKLVYYEEIYGIGWELHVFKDGESTQLISDAAHRDKEYVNRNFIFNRDFTQVLIALETNLWFSMDGSKAVCVADTSDLGTDWSFEYLTDYDFTCRSTSPLIRDDFRTIYLPAKNLCEQLYRFAGALLYLDSNLSDRYFAAQVPEHPHESSVCGDQLVYLEKSQEYEGYDLYYTSNFREAGTVKKIPIEYAEDAVITKNGSIYVENDIGQLYLVNGDDAPRLIATYADLIGRYELDGITYVFFTQDPGSRTWEYDEIDLYRIEDVSGAKPQKVASGIYGAHIDVTGIYTYENSTRTSDGEGWLEDIRYSKDGKSFVFLCTQGFGP